MKLARFLLNISAQFLPPTRLFRLKRALYRAAGASIGADVKINSHCSILGRGQLVIGERTWVGVNTRFVVPFPAKITVGANCDIAPDVAFLCGSHVVGGSERRAGLGKAEDIHIGSGCWIGSRALILPGVSLGSGTVVAAGSVVLRGKYPPNSLLAGNPAIVKRSYGN